MESQYYNNLIYIRDKKTNDIITKDRCSIEKVSSVYSNTKLPIFKLIIDKLPISRNNTYTVKFTCQTCNLEKEITLNLYMRKVNNNTTRCETCKNKNEIKNKKQSIFMKENASSIISGNYITHKTPVKTQSLEKHLEISNNDWDQEFDEFKNQYFLRNLTFDEFERIRDKIISINNDKFTNVNDWFYIPNYRVYNQTRYTPMLIHNNDRCSEKPLYIKFKCDNCDSLFIHRDLKIVKNQYKILCQTCSLTNKTFRLRKKILKNGEHIMWQSIPERRFIDWCESHEIDIKNGPNIPYTFNEKSHTYRVDFELPNCKMLIEVKDNHCWHKRQVESGKFTAKENAAKEWCNNNYKYHVIFPKTLQKFKDSILQYKSL